MGGNGDTSWSYLSANQGKVLAGAAKMLKA